MWLRTPSQLQAATMPRHEGPTLLRLASNLSSCMLSLLRHWEHRQGHLYPMCVQRLTRGKTIKPVLF